MTEAAGLYLHWPFCRVRCSYCTFFVSTEPAYRGDYLRALEREVALVGETAEGVSFDSIYLGGGTPSRLPPADLEQLLRRVRTHLTFLGDVEVTIEANPEDVEPDTVRAWTAAGVNRISLGVQSFAKAELEATGRQHDPAIGARALEMVSRSGAGVCADLILGLPEQTPGSFRDSLARLLEFSVEHVSIYLLEDSRETALDRRHNAQRYLADDAQADLWLEACGRLSEHGFSHYEISNWARPGRHARHNVKYWDRLETLGLGVSAHEFWSGHRRANVASLERYIAEFGSRTSPQRLRLAHLPGGVGTGDGRPRPAQSRGGRGRGGACLRRATGRRTARGRLSPMAGGRVASGTRREGRLHGERIPRFQRDSLPLRLSSSASRLL